MVNIYFEVCLNCSKLRRRPQDRRWLIIARSEVERERMKWISTHTMNNDRLARDQIKLKTKLKPTDNTGHNNWNNTFHNQFRPHDGHRRDTSTRFGGTICST